MAAKKKLWKKLTSRITIVGNCRYCKKSMTSDESFVVFADKTSSHYDCLVKDDQERALDKSFE